MTAPGPTPKLPDGPARTWAVLRQIFADAMTNSDRTLQVEVGPSELGEPCDRALIHKLAGHPEPDREGPAWKPEVGTAIHEWAEKRIAGHPLNYQPCQVVNCPNGPGCPGHLRFALEERVYIGDIGTAAKPRPIWGHCDLYDTVEFVVDDHKTKGKNTLRGHRLHGPGILYWRQVNLYGLAWELRGWPVEWVMIGYYPRDGEWDEWIPWAVPYDRQVALDTLARARAMVALTDTFGVDGALQMFPKRCDNEWCRWCRDSTQMLHRPNHGTPPPALRTVGAGRPVAAIPA